MANTIEIGTKLVELCRAGQADEAMTTLYAPDIVSVEAAAPPGASGTTTGLSAILAKSKQWVDAHEVHATRADGPFPNGDRFAVVFRYDVTQRSSGKRFEMHEVAVYTVSHGKIVREEFFYRM